MENKPKSAGLTDYNSKCKNKGFIFFFSVDGYGIGHGY